MKAFLSYLRSQPLLGRCALVGMIVAGVPGAIVGLVVGLNVYAKTAWAAMFELGIPATIAGGMVGLLVGCIIAMANRFRRHRAA
jgi:hypothetical protein